MPKQRQYVFPKGFRWGSAVWAQGVEGASKKDGKVKTVFEKAYEQHPEKFYQKQSPENTLNWYHRYKEYASIAQSLNHNSFRTSISWARLMPDGKTINTEALKYYYDMFVDLKSKGMDVWVVLYWFDMPLHLENRGGFRNRDILDEFVMYAKNCFRCFDNVVDIWYIYNEPGVDNDFKYMLEMCYPYQVNFKEHVQATYNMVVAHAMVVKAYKEGNYKKKIGSVLNFAKVYPRSNSKADVKAVDNFSLFHFRCYMDPLIHGEYDPAYFDLLKEVDALPHYELEDRQLIKEHTMQVLGINYYFPERVKARETKLHQDEMATREAFYEVYEIPGRIMNKSRGWEIYPNALYETLMMIKTHYNNIECYISENGIGIENEATFRNDQGEIQDDYRIEFIEQHLLVAHKACMDKVNLQGYHVWSFIDLWSPSNQFKNLYGLVEYNLENKMVAYKKSAYWYRDVIEMNGFIIREEIEK